MSDRPVIVLTSDVRRDTRTLHFVFSNYVEAVARAGGLPLHVPPLDPAAVPQVLALADGFVFVGGEDLDPALYGEAPDAHYDPAPADRQAFDVALGRALLATDHPVLGVCYGCQLLTIVTGGTLHQHLGPDELLRAHHGGRFPDLPQHEVEIAAGTRLREIAGADRIRVNTAHHQAPRDLGPGVIRAAQAPDGVTEAVELSGDRLFLGVEWHPELMPDAPEQRGLFEALVRDAERKAERRRMADRRA